MIIVLEGLRPQKGLRPIRASAAGNKMEPQRTASRICLRAALSVLAGHPSARLTKKEMTQIALAKRPSGQPVLIADGRVTPRRARVLSGAPMSLSHTPDWVCVAVMR